MNAFVDRALPGRSAREKISVFALLFALILCGLVAVGSFTSRAEAAGSCTIPTDSVAVKATDISHPDATQAWDNFHVQVSLSNLDGVPAGCTATVQLPDVFTGMSAKTTYLNADGTSSSTQRPDTVAVMATDTSGRMTFTTTDYSATHEGVSAIGWANAQITDKITSGSEQPLNFTVNGVVKQQQVSVGTCADCSALPTAPSKWGSENSDGTGTVTIQTPAADEAGAVISVSDTLASTDQTIRSVAWVQGYDCVTSWNAPGALGEDGSCASGATIPVEYTQTGQSIAFKSTVDHEFFRVGLNMTFTGDGPWLDTATVSLDGVTTRATTTVRTYDTGGSATGHDKSTSSPSTTPPSPSTSTTPPSTPPTTPTSSSTTPSTTPPSPSTSTTPTGSSTSSATTPSNPSTTPTSSPTMPCTSVTPTSSSSSTAPGASGGHSTPICGSVPAGHSGAPGQGTPQPGMGPKVQTDELTGATQLSIELAMTGVAASGLGLVALRLRRSRS